MGFFSWRTSDTYRSISNAYSSRDSLPVYLITPDNEKIYEPCYEGYGVFGGHDVFALLARWNFPDKCTGNEETDRDIWFNLTPDERDDIKFPLKFSENKNKNYDDLRPSSDDYKYQGYFYDDEDDDEY